MGYAPPPRLQAEAFAKVLAVHHSKTGLKTVLLKGTVPTPLLSFAVATDGDGDRVRAVLPGWSTSTLTRY